MARDRAHDRFAEHDFLYRAMLDGLMERIEDVSRPLQNVLVIGCPDNTARDRLSVMGKRVTCCDPGARNAALNAGVQAEEDGLPFPESSFDLVLACGTLDSINDLPGALINARRVLKPDGLFLAACTGAGTLPRLKSALLQAEGDRASAHIHPQIDIRAAGDLLARAGFSMPVADLEMLTVRYNSIFRLMHDLRNMGGGNVMTSERRGALAKGSVARAAAHFSAEPDSDGKTSEQFALLFLSGWKPDPSQPLPAARGSGKMSLADALKPKA
jgi:SAM-dependent methyltransferase